MQAMILVTGGTGFVGKALIRHLVENGLPVRTLIRPSTRSPNLPRGVPVDVAVTALNDERGLRAAMVGVDTVYHLASGEWKGARASLMEIDIQGTQAVVRAAQDAGVERIFYISHLGADRASAYPVLKVKAIAEEYIRRSGLDYTILRSAILFGPGDGLTTGLARIMQAVPFGLLTPGDGSVLLQPLWVEDLVTCLVWALDDPDTRNRTFEVGGPEYLTFSQVASLVMQATGRHRRLIGIRPPYLRALTVFLEFIFPNLPVSVYWLDYLAVNRTCALDTIPRVFNLMPSRMSQRLAYLQDRSLQGSLVRSLFQRG
ncbi:MAG: NAD(P)H-binding protein [Chloroflexi bacterium]|jgi:NADH dehydrogenase|nr:NAD(P)H-binding protein [Chloroflexota bacterium]